MNFSQEELADMLYVLGDSNGNCTLTKRLYAFKYPNRRQPQAKALQRLKQRFDQTGSVQYWQKQRRPTILTEDNCVNILVAVVENPYASQHEISINSNVSRASVQKCLSNNKFRGYHLQKVHALLPTDFEKRVQFCRWALQVSAQIPDFFNKVLFTDECSFSNVSPFNMHNVHYYADINPHITRVVNRQNRWSINVWGGILGPYIIGPYFFQGTLTGATYLRFLEETLFGLLEEIPLDIRHNMWYQHDGAPPHSTYAVRRYLNTTFPGRWIGRGGQVTWPARSPDLNKCDFFCGDISRILYIKGNPQLKKICGKK